MIKYHCPKIIRYLGEAAVTDMLDNTEHFYPPNSIRRPELNVVMLEDDRRGAVAAHATALARAPLSQVRIPNPTARQLQTKATLDRLTLEFKEVLVIDDGPVRTELHHIDRRHPTHLQPSTHTTWGTGISDNLNPHHDVTVIFWLKGKKENEVKMRTASLCARKDGMFVMGDHKLAIFEITGLVVYDSLEFRWDRRWNETTWYAGHRVRWGGVLVFRTPDAYTGDWQLDVDWVEHICE